MPGNIINLTPADIAKWPAPNYDNPERRAWMPEYASVLFAGATLMVGTRLWLRLRGQAGGLGLDDFALVMSWFCLTWFTVLAILGSEKYMTSRHVWDVPLTEFVPMARLTWIAEMAFLFTGCFVKVSVLLFYRRLVEPICSRGWMIAVLSAIALTIAYTLAFTLALVFNCTPTDAYWKAFDLSYSVKYHCANTTAINLLAGILAAVSDLYAVALPCIMMRDVQLPRAQKVALNAIFCLGLLVVAASSVRTYHLYECGHTADVTTAIFNVFVWSQLELCLGIMCASAPSLRVLFREYLSEPLSRVKRSITSGRSRKDSEVEHVIIRRVESPADTLIERHDFGAKHTPTTSSTFSGGWGSSPTTAVPSHPDKDSARVDVWEKIEPVVRTPADYESFNLQNMERYRQYSRSQSVVEEREAHELRDMRGQSWLNLSEP